jgi:hypothetical protein
MAPDPSGVVEMSALNWASPATLIGDPPHSHMVEQ